MGTSVACAAVGVPRATIHRHRQPKAAAAPQPRPAPPRALSGEERKQVLDVLHSEWFADQAPAETYAKLLDQSQHLAERLIRETLVKEGILRDQLTIHSDRGPAMRSQAVAQLLATLGVTKSHSRPHVSDDNPFSESQRTRSSEIETMPDKEKTRSGQLPTPGRMNNDAF